MTKKKYHGVIAPLITPIEKSGKIDDGSVENLFRLVLKHNNFPFILGTTGEIALNPVSNRDHLTKLAVKIVNDKTTLYAGITDNCVETTINTAKKYSDYGVDVFVVHLPYFFPLTPDLMMKYFEFVADNSPRPIIIYNIKSITNMSIPVDIIEKLSLHPNIVALKDSERDYERVEKLAQLFKNREDFSLFIGWTNKSSQALLMGFDGIIPNTTNVTPGLFQSLYEAAIKGDEKTAMEFQERAETLSVLVQNNKAMTRTIPEIKAILNHLNICKPFVQMPLVPLTEEENKILINEYSKLSL
ncbi:MAG: dihydrodipicolinate synthase family protein [Melioribacteraceae bacterium]|nr:dihydrodipicolinate synthase family protein [Melioribacteraceae bacterium]